MNIELLVLSGFEREKVSPHAEPHRRPIPASHNPEHQDFFCVDGRPSPVVATRRALGFLWLRRSRRERGVDGNAIDRFGLVVPPGACTGTLFGRQGPPNPIGGASSRKVFECTHFLRALALRSCASDFGPQVLSHVRAVHGALPALEVGVAVYAPLECRPRRDAQSANSRPPFEERRSYSPWPCPGGPRQSRTTFARPAGGTWSN